MPANPTHPTRFDLPDLDDALAQCADLLEQMDAMLCAIEPLAPQEIARATKLPREGDAVVGELAAQCNAVELTQADRATTVAGMLDALRRARALRAVIESHDLVAARLRAARVQAEAQTWRSALTFYAVLRRMAAHEPSVEERLEPVAAFFRRRRAGRRYVGGRTG